MNTGKWVLGVVVATGLVSIASVGHAATITWDGGNGNFNLNTNWDTDTVPGAADVADTNTTTNNTITYPQTVLVQRKVDFGWFGLAV